jgi:hypothetical protein
MRCAAPFPLELTPRRPSVFDHTTQQVTALSRTADHVDLFVIDSKSAVRSTWWDAEHGWQPWFQIL